MVDFMFTFVVTVQLPFFDYDELMELMQRDLKNESNIEFLYSRLENYKYRVVMWNCTRKKVDDVCNTLQGYQIRQLDIFTAKCVMEIFTDIKI